MTVPDYSQQGGSIKDVEDASGSLLDKLDPFSAINRSSGRIPFWSTGARSYIRIGGKAVGMCTDIRWQVNYESTPIHTIDTPHAWDIDIGQMTVSATLNNIFDPTKGPEFSGMFANMQSAVHQPMVEMQVLDALGTSIFFARGIFTQLNGNVARGQVSTFSAQFKGIFYQHYVQQQFKPYTGVAGGVSNLVGKLKDLVSKASGGLF